MGQFLLGTMADQLTHARQNCVIQRSTLRWESACAEGPLYSKTVTELQKSSTGVMQDIGQEDVI